MRTKLLLFILSISLFACSAQKNKHKNKTLSDSFYTTWQHSHEEDTKTEKIFRPISQTLPVSRGREKLEFKSENVFVHHRIGANDAPEKKQGTWNLKSSKILVLSVEGEQDTELQILEVSDKLLKIKK